MHDCEALRATTQPQQVLHALPAEYELVRRPEVGLREDLRGSQCGVSPTTTCTTDLPGLRFASLCTLGKAAALPSVTRKATELACCIKSQIEYSVDRSDPVLMRRDKQLLTFSKDAGRGLAAVEVVSASSIVLQRRIGCGSGHSNRP